MEDLFEREQKILDHALEALSRMEQGEPCHKEDFSSLVKEYGKILRQLRRITRISDKTAENLNSSRLDLLDQIQYDTLTGIYSRRFLEKNLAQVVESLERASGTLCVMMADVDSFKKYNDTYGHSMGDKCLRAVAEAICSAIEGSGGFAARYGGEEFTVVLPGCDKEPAVQAAGRILDAVQARRIPHIHNLAADVVTISIGVTSGPVTGRWKGADFLKRADEALYQSKQGGRNRATFISF